MIRAILALAVALTALPFAPVAAMAETYDPMLAVTDGNMRHYDSMSQAQIQSFLEANNGPLKAPEVSSVTTDYAGVQKPPAQIIYEAAQIWKINPKILLATLQKEQSLIESPVTPKTLQYRLDNAMGCGVYDSDGDGDVDRKYPGFGPQVYHCARSYDNYGEGKTQTHNGQTWGPIVGTFTAGVTRKQIYDYTLKQKVYVYPKNIATFKLYTYTPYSSGPKTTNTLYTKYFGSPLSNPRYRPIFRFKKLSSGSYLYTASVSERYKLQLSPKSWRYDGTCFSSDSSATTETTRPVYRFYNYTTKKYSFTTSESLRKSRTTAKAAKTWKYSGVAFLVGKGDSAGAVKVYRFRSKKSGHVFLTKSDATVAKYRTKAKAKIWKYEGVAYYLPRVAETTPTPTP
ncbi:MAG TPA: hypothetical protein VFG89_00145 [Coriobacteriia bacterium]|nr:hypothetical protein [Coriobacteriia bacterium]